MSGIVGSYFNTRGSGVVAKLGTDGQVFTSTGAGLSQGFEAAAGGGAWTLIKTITSDGSDADMSFVNGASSVVFDSTYKIYEFHWQNIHPETNKAEFSFQVSTDTGSSYGIASTQTQWRFYNTDSGSNNENHGSISVPASGGTAYLNIGADLGNDADQTCSGVMTFYNPAETTYSKLWLFKSSNYVDNDYTNNNIGGGIIKTTSALDAIQFKMDGGEIQGGTISMYGLTT